MTENGQATRDALKTEGIVKRFGAVTALSGVDLHLGKGEVLGLVGDNGAGKSTLIKIITGFHRPDRGRVIIEDREVHLRSVSQARKLGIETVYQDLALVDDLPVYLNMFLNKELTVKPLGLLNHKEMKRRARQYLNDMRVSVPDVTEPVGLLSGGQRQAIAIARAVYSDVKILLLDEPLAAMGAKEGAQILNLIQRLKGQGDVSMILIAHNYVHIMDVCDRINLLRHGRITFDKRVQDTSMDELTDIVVSEFKEHRAVDEAVS